MSNKLSLYVNLRSIAWVISNQQNKIVRSGIKRVNVDFDTYYEFIAGQPVSKRTNRRTKRTMRRNAWRRRSRKANLVKLLLNYAMLPDTELMNLDGTNIYQLRHLATRTKLNPAEFGRVCLSLLNKRGYKSMRGTSMNDASEYLAAIAQHEV